MKLAGVILMGGRNGRMNGDKKAFLRYRGEMFYQHAAASLAGLAPIYLSVDTGEGYEELGYPLIVDQFSAIGPLGGLCSALRTCREDALFVLPCDMPKLPRWAVDAMTARWKQRQNPIILCDDRGWHPLVGIYHKTNLPVLERRIAGGDYRAAGFAGEIGAELFPAEYLADAAGITININSPDEYQSCISRHEKGTE